MSIYTVHAPPAGESSDPERFVFVRDGFYWSAFLFAPFWMIWRRQWMVLVIYVGVLVVLTVLLRLLNVPAGLQTLAVLLLSLLIGFEASTLRRWTLDLKSWREIGLVGGSTREEAEQRFYASWTESPSHSVSDGAPPSSPAPRTPVSFGTSEIVGLFPEPQSRS